jgi:tripartite-type tricarboxylate transporter receptor subunit TctC
MLRSGVSIVGIPYRGGGELLTALLSQSVHMLFSDASILLPLIREGKLRALAVTTKARMPSAPDIPTMIEAGVPDYEALSFFGIVAPKGTPAGIVSKINATLDDALKTPEVQETISKLGAVPQTGSPEDFAATIATHLEKWRALAKAAKLRID